MRKIGCALLLMGLIMLTGCVPKTEKELIPTSPPPKGELDGWTIAVDAGHGGMDNGCVGVSGSTEAELNLAVAFCLKDALEAEGARVVMTRTDASVEYDETRGKTKKAQDMADRVDTLEKEGAQLVISIHMNRYSDPKVRGAQSFYDGDDTVGRQLASALQKSLNAMEEQVKKRSAMSGNYFILKTPGCPGALVECGFLSNPEEETLLLSAEYRQHLAQALCRGIAEFCRSGQK